MITTDTGLPAFMTTAAFPWVWAALAWPYQ